MGKYYKVLLPIFYIGIIGVMVACILLVITGIKNYVEDSNKTKFTLDSVFEDIVEPVNKWLGFKPRSKQYCFVGMMIRYCFCAIPLMFLVGMKFFACAFAIPFIYNAMFWVELPNTKYCSSPTNWAEWFSGLIIGWALM